METDAATFARQHDPDAAMLDVDDAIERVEGGDLIRASGTPTQLRITLRGQAFLQALHEGRHDPTAYARARQLYGGQARPNPSQASFSWAGDPRQLTMSFDAPPKEREPEASAEDRAAFGRSSAAQLRKPKPKRAPKPKAPPKPPREGYLIKLGPKGAINEDNLMRWVARADRRNGPPPPSFGDKADAAFARYRRAGSIEDEKRAWRDYAAAVKRAQSEGWPFVKALEATAGEEAEAYNAHQETDWQRSLSYDARDAFTAYASAQRLTRRPYVSQKESQAIQDNLEKEWSALLLALLGGRRNPSSSTELRSTRGKTETKRAREAAQAEIRRQRAEQKRARADRKAEMDQARGQTKRIREKVTAASRGRRERIRARAWERIDRANARIAEMRAQKAWASGKAPKAGHGRVWEQNEEVEREIKHLDPMLVPLWRANRGQFKGTAHERFERFLEWADEKGEGDVWAAIEKTLPTDRQLASDYEAWAAEQASA